MANEEDLSLELIELILKKEINTFYARFADVKQAYSKTKTGEFSRLIDVAGFCNQLDLMKWLHENCPDCNINTTGFSLINGLGRVYEEYEWNAMNSEAFKYICENGALDSFHKNDPERSLVTHVSDYYIPEEDRKKDRYEILSYIFSLGYSANEECGATGKTALFNAVERNDETLVDFLLKNGANPKIGPSPLSKITSSISPDFLRKILGWGLDPNEITKQFYSTPEATSLLGRIIESSTVFHGDLLSVLEEHNVDFNRLDSHGRSPIDYAHKEFEKTKQPYTEYLLAKGAKKTARYYYSVFIKAVQNKEHDIIDEILALHPELANGWGEGEDIRPLTRALWAKDTIGFQKLIDAGADLDAADVTNIFETAIERELYEIAEIILEQKTTLTVSRLVKIDESEVLWSPSLKSASSKGNVNWVKRLLDMGAVVTAHKTSHLPIYRAALFSNCPETVKLLLDAGSVRNPVVRGKSLFDTLAEDENIDMLKLLKTYKT